MKKFALYTTGALVVGVIVYALYRGAVRAAEEA